MVVKVNLPNQENGTEPVVHEEQAAPIVGKDVEWKEQGTVNDGHETAEPKGKVPAKQAQSECGDSGACGLPEPPPTDSGSNNASSVPESPPVDAYDDLPWAETDTDGQGADVTPEPATGAEAAKAEGDGQGEESGEVETPAEETGSEVESVCTDELVDDNPPSTKAAVTKDVSMSSHGQTISTDHDTEMVEVPAQVGTMPLAKVRYSCGFTRNVGEFNSVRADVSIELPCGASDEEIAETYLRATELVDSRLQDIYEQVGVQDDTAKSAPPPMEEPKPIAPQPVASKPDLPPPPPM